jgi:hypothetical protein
MWQINNRTPFAAERGWVRDRNGAEVWLIALKCTFDVQPDGSVGISPDQPPVTRAPEYHGEPGQSSLKLESDLVLTKTTTDIVVLGHAYAPDATPVEQIDAGFRVGPVRKLLRVFGDRTWDGSAPTPPQPFLEMPLVYERAFGGKDARSATPERDWEWRNPVGTGFGTSRGNLQGIPVANIEYPDQLIRSWRDHPDPAGFGPVAGHWQPRAGLAGTYDEQWLKERQPLLPQDFNERFFQAAPVDQQAPGFLRGGEPVVLLRLTPGGELRFQLPRVFPAFETRFSDGSRLRHTDRKLHSVILEPDFPRVSLVWHSALPCHFKVHKLEQTIVSIKEDVGAPRHSADEDEAELA